MKHLQKGGEAYYDEEDFFLFAPDNISKSLKSFRAGGVGQLSADGTFEFVRTRRKRAASDLIKRTNHCRLAHTKDAAIQLTCKIFDKDGLDSIALLKSELKELFDSLPNTIEYEHFKTEKPSNTKPRKNKGKKKTP